MPKWYNPRNFPKYLLCPDIKNTQQSVLKSLFLWISQQPDLLSSNANASGFYQEIQLSLHPKNSCGFVGSYFSSSLRRDPWLHGMISHLKNRGGTKVKGILKIKTSIKGSNMPPKTKVLHFKSLLRFTLGCSKKQNCRFKEDSK